MSFTARDLEQEADRLLTALAHVECDPRGENGTMTLAVRLLR
jgi:hypothetical protein